MAGFLGDDTTQSILNFTGTNYNIRCSVKEFEAFYKQINNGNSTNRDFHCVVDIDFPYYNMANGRRDTYSDEVLYQPGTGKNIGRLAPYYEKREPIQNARRDTAARKTMSSFFYGNLDNQGYLHDETVKMGENGTYIDPILEAINPKEKDKLKLNYLNYGFERQFAYGGETTRPTAGTFSVTMWAEYLPNLQIPENTKQKNTDVDVQEFKDLVCKCLARVMDSIFLNEPDKIPPMKFGDQYYPIERKNEVDKYYEKNVMGEMKVKPKYIYKPSNSNIFQVNWWKKLFTFDVMKVKPKYESERKGWIWLWLEGRDKYETDDFGNYIGRTNGNESYKAWIKKNKEWIKNNPSEWESLDFLPPGGIVGAPQYGEKAYIKQRNRDGKAPEVYAAPTYISRDFVRFRTNAKIPQNRIEAILGQGRPSIKQNLKF